MITFFVNLRGVGTAFACELDRKETVDAVKITQFKERSMKPAVISPEPAEGDALEAFGTETAVDRPATEVVARSRPNDRLPTWVWSTGKAAALVVLGAAVGVAALIAYQSRGLAPAPATLTLQTTPPGAQVSVDGKASGQTPVSMQLVAGTHRVALVAPDGRTRDLDVVLNAGASVVHQIEWADAPASAPVTGTLHIQTDPPGRAVVVDDTARGVSPVTVPGLSVGEHTVIVSSAEGSLRRQVTINAGQTVSLVVAPTNSTAVSGGWLRVISPLSLQLRANGKFVGTTEAERVMLPAGDYDIEMVNDALGFATKQHVKLAPGKTADVRVTPPNGTLSINAVPWADVWVNNEHIGETPIANLSRTIGTHEVVLRHPQFGERRRRVTISLKETARLGVDMRQP